MKFVIAPDSFKGSLTAKEAADAIEVGVRRVFADAEIDKVPMADGGEGTVQALTDATDGQLVTKQVIGPLDTQVSATYGLLGDGETAVIEMLAASGIQFIDEQTQNPLIATTYGTGQLIIDAINHGVNKIILGLGGSATNDGGAGMAQAIGVKLFDDNNNELAYGGGELGKLAKIDMSNVDERIKNTAFLIASDVTNPLTGTNGASAVFGPQKGATEEMVASLDESLHHYAQIINRDLDIDIEQAAGSGAAGGLGAGLLAFTGAQIQKGIDIVVAYSKLESRLENADVVITGEGSMDFQTKYGKMPYGVALAAKKIAPHAPVIGFVGKIGKRIEELYETGVIDAIFAAPSSAKSLEEAIVDSAKDLSLLAENIARLMISLDKK
ncbi:glycerate kinase family protein [Weissella hellenica]|uniref:glycerate kinase family protein n=1 Tax=Weissella hellenica TaxID=46256 RepID=UPI003888E290